MGVTELLLVRHGESVANVCSQRAWAAGDEQISTPIRDADVGLTDTGLKQAAALGQLLVGPAPAVWCSPFVRAQLTVRLALEAAGLAPEIHVDERLRDRDFGVVDRLTAKGIAARYPDEAARKRWHGKFYYRPAGGESWTDVALRARGVLRDLDDDPAVAASGGRVLISCHDAVVLVFRYICERLDEAELLALRGSVPNGSLTRLVRDDSTWTCTGVEQPTL